MVVFYFGNNFVGKYGKCYNIQPLFKKKKKVGMLCKINTDSSTKFSQSSGRPIVDFQTAI